MEGTLKVTPEELISSSQEFSSINTQVTNITNQELEKIRSISSWIGDAKTAYVGKFDTLEEEMVKIRQMIEEHCTDLQEMARNYQTAEETNVETAQALKSNIF